MVLGNSLGQSILLICYRRYQSFQLLFDLLMNTQSGFFCYF
jgi:hypothetical protein